MKTKKLEILSVVEIDGEYYKVERLNRLTDAKTYALSDLDRAIQSSERTEQDEPTHNMDELRYAVSMKPKKKVRGKYRQILSDLGKKKTYIWETSSMKEKRSIYQGVYSATKKLKGRFAVSSKGNQVTATRLR